MREVAMILMGLGLILAWSALRKLEQKKNALAEQLKDTTRRITTLEETMQKHYVRNDDWSYLELIKKSAKQ